MTQLTPIKEELANMGKIVRILEKLDGITADRIVGWLYERYEHPADDSIPDEQPTTAVEPRQ